MVEIIMLDMSVLLSRSRLFPSPTYCFDSGHLDYDVAKDIPLRVLGRLIEKHEGLLDGDLSVSDVLPFQEPIKTILASETSLGTSSDARIKVFDQSARGSIDHVLSRVVGRHGSVALPLPNWTFWDHLRGVQKGDYTLNCFMALDPDQLVENYKTLLERTQVKALLLVHPSNPLGYTLSPDILKELDRISEREGVAIVIDDLLRGNQPVGDRETIAASLSRPYLVEGFSHRFGANPLGSFSYVLVPEEDRLIEAPQLGPSIYSEVLAAAYRYSTPKIAREMQRRNKAFDEEISRYCPDVRISRPSITSISSILELPPESRMSAIEFSHYAERRDVGVYPVDSFFPTGVRQPNRSSKLLRIAVGSMKEDMIREGAEKLGMLIGDLC
ncbi:aminotransferase class I/II-fold pyridoxal phosphate-dependent enzyme [Candidatus Woesearchaeota archaeon]|nr:aminotransferase class I/II-fold pyridoxal phosphate-dependent enzyme [Candidatus Woesearchaeota archaeon]